MRLGPSAISVDRSAITASAPITSEAGELACSAFTVGVADPVRSIGAEPRIETSVAPFVPMAVVAALLFGEDLHIGAPITRQQADSVEAAATLLCRWLDRPRPAVSGPIIDEPSAAPAGGVGLFFTRGIDSWSSLLEHRHRVTHLLFLDGVEPRMSEEHRARVRADSERVAADLGLPLVTLTTNGRTQLDPHCNWEYTHGAIMASAALLLAPLLGEVLIASSHMSGHTRPWGTHADLDHLWSTPDVRFRHDGGQYTRWEKTARVAAYQPALDSLHVCFAAAGDRNCGRCHKCLLTMSALAGVGALDRCSRFDAVLDVDAIVGLEPRPPGRNSNVLDLLDHLPPDSALAAAWARVLPPEDLAGRHVVGAATTPAHPRRRASLRRRARHLMRRGRRSGA